MSNELTTTQPLSLAVRTERAAQICEDEWQLRLRCLALAGEALDHYELKGSKKLGITAIGHLLELSSTLGRRSTGMPTEQIEFSTYNDPAWLAQINKELDEVYGKPIDISSEKLPPSDTNSQSSNP